MSSRKITIPKPIPLKDYLYEEGRTQLRLRDKIAVKLNTSISDAHISRIINGQRPAPLEWAEPLSEILGIDIDIACYLLGLEEPVGVKAD